VSMVGRIGLLVILWLLAWGDISVANIVSGVAVAALLLLAFPVRGRGDGSVGLNVGGALRLAGYVVAQLVVSNLIMTREILRRRPGGHSGVLAYRLEHPSEQVLTLMTSIISLSPGTMTVDVASDSTTVYVHFFNLGDIEAARASLARLERLVAGAIIPRPMLAIDESEKQN
jgi:multicomponent Na+:H+ antiporter subunit E